jgi:fructose-bisphosphate aldolase class II
MLINLQEILKIAEDKSCAIGAFNTPTFEALQAVIGAAQELNVPVIVQYAEEQERYNPFAEIGPVMVMMAKAASVPVCAHLDHGLTLEFVQRGMEMGFTSAMLDGSKLPYTENVAISTQAAQIAHKYGAGIEAELGSMGLSESGVGSSGGDDEKIYTDPDKAQDFVQKTGIDALACSFGTTHGIYLKEPKLDFTIVERVRKLTGNIPVVMHGGSGVSAADYTQAIAAGVRKINYWTYMNKAGGVGVRELFENPPQGKFIYFTDVANAGKAAMKENAMAAMKVFYSNCYA